MAKESSTNSVHGICTKRYLRRSNHSILSSSLFGSLCGMNGQWDHTNYASGNTFLEALVQYHHSYGLPASVFDMGAMEDVGYLSQNKCPR